MHMGPPDTSGYGLATSARGHGYGGEAPTAPLTVAANHGVATFLADTTVENVASQRTLANAGFTFSALTPTCSTTRSGRPNPRRDLLA